MAASRPPDAGRNGRGSTLGRILRTILWALVVAFVVGFVIGTLLRRELEKPVRYIGDRGGAASVAARDPGHVGHARARVLVPGDHEEQVG